MLAASLGDEVQFSQTNATMLVRQRRVADDSQGSVTEIDNPKVKLERNSLGTIFMEIEGSNQAPRVRRER